MNMEKLTVPNSMGVPQSDYDGKANPSFQQVIIHQHNLVPELQVNLLFGPEISLVLG